MALMKTCSITILLFSSLLMLCTMSNGQLLTRRQLLNRQRQQQQLDEQENVLARQQSAGVQDESPVSRATFERLFEAIRTVNELLQALSAIRARLNSDSSQLASFSLPNMSNQ